MPTVTSKASETKLSWWSERCDGYTNVGQIVPAGSSIMEKTIAVLTSPRLLSESHRATLRRELEECLAKDEPLTSPAMSMLWKCGLSVNWR